MAKNITETVRGMLTEFLAAQCCELWNVEFMKAGKTFQLIVYVDKDGGITADDCEIVSRYLEKRLDETDLIEQNYDLIVSSPGMDRTLLTDSHFERYVGTPVEVSLYQGFEGRKNWKGVLRARTQDSLMLTADEDGRELCVPRALVSKVRLQVIF